MSYSQFPSFAPKYSFIFGKSSITCPGSSRSIPVSTDTFVFRLRRTSCPRGTTSLLTKKPNATHRSENATGHFITDTRLTPHERIAAISLSALIRENTRTLETSSASGIVHCIVSGKLTSANCPMSAGDTPSRMNPTICTMSPIVSTNDSTRNASRKLDRKDPNTYRSIVFKSSKVQRFKGSIRKSPNHFILRTK